MKTGLFPQANGIVQMQPTLATGQRYREVTTPVALRAAIADAATVSQTTSVDAIRGMKIAIAAPMKFSEPVVIPLTAVGLEITALGGMSLTADGIVSSLFVVHAPFVVLRGLFVPIPTNTANRFAAFVVPGLWLGGLAPINVTIDDNFVAADALYLDAAPSFIPANWHITRNRFQMGADTDAAIDGNASQWLIHGNTFEDCTTAILLAGGGGQNRIEANDGGGGVVSTIGSAGTNVVAGNTAVLVAGTTHATDAVGLNT